jgi:hypothetical protein
MKMRSGRSDKGSEGGDSPTDWETEDIERSTCFGASAISERVNELG